MKSGICGWMLSCLTRRGGGTSTQSRGMWALSCRSKLYGSMASIFFTYSLLEEPARVLPHAEKKQGKWRWGHYGKTIRNIYFCGTLTALKLLRLGSVNCWTFFMSCIIVGNKKWVKVKAGNKLCLWEAIKPLRTSQALCWAEKGRKTL